MSCVNIASKEFKSIVQRLNVNAATVEDIIHDYQLKHNTDEFPSDDYIMEKLSGLNHEFSDAQLSMWNSLYSKDVILNTREALDVAKNNALKYFTAEAITSYETADGKFALKVARPDATKERIHAVNKLRQDAQKFLDEFQISIRDVEDFGGGVQLFDALNRTINIRNADDVSEGVGAAIAFMMQHHSMFKEIRNAKILEHPSKAYTGAFGENAKVTGTKVLSLYRRALEKNKSLRRYYVNEIGKDIARELRKAYSLDENDVEIKDEPNSLAAKVWKMILDFFDKITPIRKNMIATANANIKRIADTVAMDTPYVVLENLKKPGTDKDTYRVDVETAFKENPYEEDIISFLSGHGIALGGSTSIALAGTLYRPTENPLHDIDFTAAGHTKQSLTRILEGKFDGVTHLKTIDSGTSHTETFLVMDRPVDISIGTKKETRGFTIHDKKTGEFLGRITLKNDLILKDGVKGKILDFFTNEAKFPSYTREIGGKEYLVADYRSAMEAKVTWTRPKDVWDYTRFNSNEYAKERMLDQQKALAHYDEGPSEYTNEDFIPAPVGIPIDREILSKQLEYKKVIEELNKANELMFRGDSPIERTLSNGITIKTSKGVNSLVLRSGNSAFNFVKGHLTVHKDGKTVDGIFIFPSKSIIDPEFNFNRIENNAMRKHYFSMAYNIALYLKDKGYTTITSESSPNYRLEEPITEADRARGAMKKDQYEKTTEAQKQMNAFINIFGPEAERVFIIGESLIPRGGHKVEKWYNYTVNLDKFIELLNKNQIGLRRDNEIQTALSETIDYSNQISTEVNVKARYDNLVEKSRNLYNEIERLKEEKKRKELSFSDLPFDKSGDFFNQPFFTEKQAKFEIGKDYTLDDIEAEFNRLGNTLPPEFHQLAHGIFNTAKDLGLKVKIVERKDIRAKGAALADRVFYPKNVSASTLLHEVIHGITTYYMELSDRSLRDNAPKEVVEAVKELNDLYKEIYPLYKESSDYLNEQFRQTGLKHDRYGFKDSLEFVAELANPDFIRTLQALEKKYATTKEEKIKRNWWQRIVNAISKMIGQGEVFATSRTVKEDKDIVNKAMLALEVIMMNPNKDTFEGVSDYIKERVKDNPELGFLFTKYSHDDASQQNTSKNVIIRNPANWTRQEAQSHPENLYIFTDNTDRSSGGNLIDSNSKYSKKYGAGKRYPNSTQAVLRGLDNAMPISTQRWYHEGAKGKTGQWKDEDLLDFYKVISREVDDIIDEFATGKYKNVVLGPNGIFNGPISEFNSTRVPTLFNVMNQQLVYLNTIVNALAGNSSTMTPEEARQHIANRKRISQVEGYSGAAAGSDTMWRNLGMQVGIGDWTDYVASDMDRLKPEWAQEVENAYQKAANDLGRPIQDANTYVGKLVRRDYMQVKAADAAFAIAPIIEKGGKNAKGFTNKADHDVVDGGTGYAVQMAINMGKPVHVFDLRTNTWKEWDYKQNRFVATETPRLTPKFAGIGTRELTPSGEQAIKDVYLKTASEGARTPEINQAPSGQSKTYTKDDTIDVWSTTENGFNDLSNFAQRPFKAGSIEFNSVEQGFQYTKFEYMKQWIQMYGEGKPVETAVKQIEDIQNKILAATEGAEIKHLGGTRVKSRSPHIQDLINRFFEKQNPYEGNWETRKEKALKASMRLSFEQNPQAKAKLLSTGEATLTHVRGGEYATTFPRLLTELREDFKNPKKDVSLDEIVRGPQTVGQAYDNLAQQAEQPKKVPMKDLTRADIMKRFQVKMVDYSKVEVEFVTAPWEDDANKTKASVRVYLKGQKDKGYFELVSDTNFENTEFNDEYSVHFKTGDADTKQMYGSTKEERNLLYAQVRDLIPPGAKVSTWGNVSLRGKAALDKLCLGWERDGVREVKDREGKPFKVSIYTKPSTSQMSEAEKYLETQSRVIAQVNTLINSSLITSSEVSKVASEVVYHISALLNELQQNLGNVDKLQEILKNKGIEDINTEKLSTASSRRELVQAITANKLSEYTKNIYANKEGKYEDVDTIVKAAELADNWEAVMLFAQSYFKNSESFTINPLENTVGDLNESANPDDMSNTNAQDADAIAEVEGSLQEHWQVEFRTRAVMSDLTDLLKSTLNGLPSLVFKGYDEQGNMITEEEKDEYGGTKHLKLREVVGSLLSWFKEAQTIKDMADILEAKKEDNPWVKDIIDKLRDETGLYSDFQNQFFSKLYKPFQIYDTININKGRYSVNAANTSPASTQILRDIQAQYELETHPLFTPSSGVNETSLNKLTEILTNLKNFNSTNSKNLAEVRGDLVEMYGLLGFETTKKTLVKAVKKDNLGSIISHLDYMIKHLSNHTKDTEYNPFEWVETTGKNDYIKGDLTEIIKPISDIMDEIGVSSFYTAGKMYQSYTSPSYLTQMLKYMTTSDKTKFRDYINKEFGKYAWFKRTDITDFNRGWRNGWLRQLINDEKTRGIFAHKVNLSSNKKGYMRGMNHLEYALSTLAEYWSESTSLKNGNKVPAWFRVTILANKPSSEFIRFWSERGINYKQELTKGLKEVFDQEMSRITTVRYRNRQKGDVDFIQNFDAKGRDFVMLDYFNEYLNGSKSDSKLGKLINKSISKALEGKALSDTESIELWNEAKKVITETMDTKVKNTILEWNQNGIREAMIKKIQGINESNVDEKIENFIWNDTYAQHMMMELYITDPAFYKNSDDIQKRIAQIHAPGRRPNIFARDYKGNLVSDGTHRSITFKDFFPKSNVLDNVKEVFRRKIENAPNHLKASYRAIANDIINSFANTAGQLNATDAQAYSSPSSYRKKAIMFGEWSEDRERVYQALKEGTYTFSDLKTAFQPMKPFKYGQSEVELAKGLPMETHKLPSQNKDAEYLLIMADALLQGEKTSKPNLLRVMYEVMEDSESRFPTKGIDTIQSSQAVKSGGQGEIDLGKFVNAEGDITTIENDAKKEMLEALYGTSDEAELSKLDANNPYNRTFVNHSDYTDFMLIQEVPAHFKDHEQPHPSQERYITISDMVDFDAQGNPVSYTIKEADGTERKVDANTFKTEYENTIFENIKEDLNRLRDELMLDSGDALAKNTALSNILQREILGSPRYGIDLWLACSINKATRDFLIPKGDPIQAKRIEQLINSVIKNRVNKQELPGGPVVQVSNFGMSRELNIRFKSKKGGLLDTKKEYGEKNSLTGEELDTKYKEYIQENQAGYAYMEVYAPIYDKDLFEKFADENGNIDMEAITHASPELLEMVAARIPSEDKFSLIPMKIVGFVPREAGEVVIMPYDVTLITGSDFDVDKMYLQRKKLFLKRLGMADKYEGTGENRKLVNKGLRTILREAILDEVGKNESLQREALKFAQQETTNWINDMLLAEYRKEANGGQRYTGQLTDEEKAQVRKEWLAKNKDKSEARYTAYYRDALESIASRNADSYISSYLNGMKSTTAAQRIEGKDSRSKIDKILDRVYRKQGWTVEKPTEGKVARDNMIIDMTLEVLGHETNTDKMLTPQGFAEAKTLGIIAEALRKGLVSSVAEYYSLSSTIQKEIANKVKPDMNLSFIDSQIQYYKQNAAASVTLGMFAVQKVAHAVLGGDGYRLAVKDILSSGGHIIDNIKIGDVIIDENSELDAIYDSEGNFIGLTIGTLVAASADAAKEPCLGQLNITGMTGNIVSTMLRYGVPFRTAAMFLSTSAISEMMNRMDKENLLTGYSSLNKVINAELADIKEKAGTSNQLENEGLTEEEIEYAVRTPYNALSTELKYKILQTYNNLSKLSREVRSVSMLTRFNSIGTAVGPLIIDNLIMEHNLKNFTPYLMDMNGEEVTYTDVLDKHPILKGFASTYDTAKEIFGEDSIANSTSFSYILNELSKYPDIEDAVFNDRALLSKLADFFMSYELINSEALDNSKLDYYIHQFPKEFVSKEFKKMYPDNPFIQAIKLKSNKKGHIFLTAETTGMEQDAKDELSNGWLDLYKSGDTGKKLANDLFYYAFFRRGVGFSPESFMSLFPLALKLHFTKYLDTYRRPPKAYSSVVVDQFIRNNADNNSLVPYFEINEDVIFLEGNRTKNGKALIFSNDEDVIRKYQSVPYIKIKAGENLRLFKQKYVKSEKRFNHYEMRYEEIDALGNNGEYLEMSKYNLDNSLSREKWTITEDTNEYDGFEEDFLSKQVNEEISTRRLNRLVDGDTNALQQLIRGYAEARQQSEINANSILLGWLSNKLPSLGINYNSDTVEKIKKDLNICG